MDKFIVYGSINDYAGYKEKLSYKAWLYHKASAKWLLGKENSFFEANSERDLIRKIRKAHKVKKIPRSRVSDLNWIFGAKFFEIIE